MCQALSLIGATVTFKNLHACHCIKNKEEVIVKFKHKKQRKKVILYRIELKSKGEQLRDLQFGQSHFINAAFQFQL